MSNKQIYLYSDGGAKPNPGVGGFGVILKYGNYSKEFNQGYSLTTNNRMELMAIIYGLDKIKFKSDVIIFSDSKYVINTINKCWIDKWKQNNWFTDKKRGKKVLNIDLWKRLYKLISHHNVKFIWVKGHSGHKENERCHQLASMALKQKDLKEDIEYSKAKEKEKGLF